MIREKQKALMILEILIFFQTEAQVFIEYPLPCRHEFLTHFLSCIIPFPQVLNLSAKNNCIHFLKIML